MPDRRRGSMKTQTSKRSTTTKTFKVKVSKSVVGAVKAAGKANGEEAIKKHIATLNGG